MGVSPTHSNLFFNFSSLYSQGNDKTQATIQGTAGSVSNGMFQIRSVKMTVSDLLDLSPEALAIAADASSQTASGSTAVAIPGLTTDSSDSTVGKSNVADTTLGSPTLSEAERVEMIRVNKNAVLERVNELLAENGLEVPADQAFELTTNLMDGSVSVAGIDDEELLAAFNEALQDDEQLVELMRKTRNDLNLPEQENTVARNFTIQFNSMEPTPEDAIIEFNIDVSITQTKQMLENGTQTTDGESTEDGTNGGLTSQFETFTYQISITLSNRINTDSMLLEQLNNSKSSKTERNSKTESTDEADETEENEESEETGSVAVTGESDETNETEALPLSKLFEAFGSHFRADSQIDIGEDGISLDWLLRFSNWNGSASSDNTESDDLTSQLLYQTMNIGGTMTIPFDPTGTMTPEQQAEQVQQLFTQGVNNLFEQGKATPWASKFFAQSGLTELGIFG